MHERLSYYLASSGIPVDRIVGTAPNVQVTYQPSATPSQVALGNSLVAGFDWSQAADDAWRIQKARKLAANGVNATEALLLRAIVWVLLDELNLVRSKLVPPLPPRTLAQAKAAIAAAVKNGDAD